MIRLRKLSILQSSKELEKLPEKKLLINTINAFSYNNALKDELFQRALMEGDVLIPDGISIVWACKLLNKENCPTERIAGWDLFCYETERMEKLALSDNRRRKVMFLGSSEKVLNLIREKMQEEYPHLDVVTYSPPYKKEFSKEENKAMTDAINVANPDLLWIGMTAPKQEKWVFSHWNELNINCHCGTIGAVFDFYAGTAKRAPQRMQNIGMEWLYRLITEPKRLWRRYLIGNTEFIYNVIKEKFE